MINCSSTILLSLDNSAVPAFPQEDNTLSHLSGYADNLQAGPISLVAQVDDDEYVVLFNASTIVTIRKYDLIRDSTHIIRIMAPMMDSLDSGSLQMRGLWLENGAKIIPLQSRAHIEKKDENDREEHNQASSMRTKIVDKTNRPKKLLEIVTDSQASKVFRQRSLHGHTHKILAGVMGWDHLVGDMFGADHVTIGMDGVCLLRNCIREVASPVDVADIFFRRS